MKFIFTIMFCFCAILQAQKQLEKQIEGLHVENIAINGEGIFKIKINTHSGSTIKIKASIEGEHNEYIILMTEQVERSLTIATPWHPLFIQENDKLSAHKIISIELEVILPNAISVYAKSDIASAEIKGNYEELIVELVNGNCNLETKANYTKINTIDGHIMVLTKDTKVEANTKNGEKDIDLAINGNNSMFLNTLNGNIKVTKDN